MKKYLLFLILNSQFLIFNSFAQFPNWLWAKGMGGTSDDIVSSIDIDPVNGDVYTTGYFYGTADFDPDSSGSFNLTSSGGSQDIFISKLDNSGNFVWAKAMGGTNDESGFSIVIDPSGSGDIYTTGTFTDTVDFDPGAGVFNLTGGGGFISKLGASGNFIWAKATGGIGVSIAFDAAGSGAVYTTGSFTGTVDFDPGAGIFNLTTAGNSDIFISKLNSAGNFVWAKSISGGGPEWGNSIAVDPAGSGDVYTTGGFWGTADFDPDTSIGNVFNLTSAGYWDIFISKLDASGNFVWAKRMGGITDDDYGYSIALDPTGSGAVYTTGEFNGTADFDPGSGIFNLSGVNQGIFISKLDTSGNFVWAKGIDGMGSDVGRFIAIDTAENGDVYTTGTFAGTADFDPGALVFNLTSAGWEDIFISKLDASGNFVWAKQIDGTGRDFGNSIALDASGYMHVAGYFDSPSISFGSMSLTNAGANDIFIAKLDTSLITRNNEMENFGKGVLVFPNLFTNTTTISFSLSRSENVSLKIFDTNGRLVTTLADKIFAAGENEITWNAADVDAGIYFLQFLREESFGQSAENLLMEKLIITK